MMISFRRVWQLSFLDVQGNTILTLREDLKTINPVRIKFWVRHLMYAINYMSHFEIYNLSPSTRAIAKRAHSIVFQAGYDDNIKLIHKGIITNTLDLRPQPDYVLLVASQDIFDNVRPLSGELQSTLTDRQAILNVANRVPQIVVQNGNLKGLTDLPINVVIPLDNITYIEAFQRLENNLTVRISVTNNVLSTSSKEPETTLPDGSEVITLNYLNGMIGSPQIDLANSGITVKSLLNADLVPGNFVKVDSISPQVMLGGVNYIEFSQEQATRGTWKIFSVDHVGDSRGGEWNSNVSGFGAALLFP